MIRNIVVVIDIAVIMTMIVVAVADTNHYCICSSPSVMKKDLFCEMNYNKRSYRRSQGALLNRFSRYN